MGGGGRGGLRLIVDFFFVFFCVEILEDDNVENFDDEIFEGVFFLLFWRVFKRFFGVGIGEFFFGGVVDFDLVVLEFFFGVGLGEFFCFLVFGIGFGDFFVVVLVLLELGILFKLILMFILFFVRFYFGGFGGGVIFFCGAFLVVMGKIVIVFCCVFLVGIGIIEIFFGCF